MAVIQSAEKLLPAGLRGKAEPFLRAVASVLAGEDPRNLAQRMALITFAIRVVSAAIAFVSQIILARVMGEFEYGIFVFVWALVVICGDMSCLGLHTTVVRFLPDYAGRNAHAEIRGLTSTARTFAMLSSTMLAMLGFLVLWLFRESFAGYYVVPLFIGLFCMPMIALGDVLDGTARAHSWALVALSPTYIVRPLLILVFMVIAVRMGAPHTALTAMVAALAATYLTTVVQFFNIVWRLRKRYVAGPRKVETSLWIRAALPIFVIEGFGFLLTNSDVIVVGLFLDPESVAIYFAAAKTMALVHFVFFSVKAAAAPRFSALFSSGDRLALARFAGETVRWSFWPSLAVGLGVVASGHFLLSLFGPAFTAGHGLMAILLAGILAKALVGPGEVLLTMSGEQRLCAIVYAVAFAANIAFNVTLIPLFGVTGAAVATASAMVVEALLLHLAVRGKLSIILFAFANPVPANLVNGMDRHDR
ncbi:oligosaccharide flippase family protein [Shinella sp. PSBB067]|uniref:lipopolysaccharide biosynthesis protein n=1 Tax=Shinella sp. PSBB067 TaxID=2715959 RepID=UPI00193BF35C|nr:oligosaccharide flippase family protein [Shinella sp. PSBB067]QRI62758.1 oligosaccharide flippase family protein [Shinella sp. PSBB067]